MKHLKRIAIGIGLLVVVGVVLGMVPSPIVIKSQVTIKASKHEAFRVLASYKDFPKWSPFVVTDPEQESWVKGEDGLVGSQFHWRGVAEESEGYQELIKMQRPNSLLMQCVITVPFESNPTFKYELKQVNAYTDVLQTFEMPASILEKMMMGLFGVTEEIRTTNELGMDRLKVLLEKEALKL